MSERERRKRVRKQNSSAGDRKKRETQPIRAKLI